jgi:F0F1-type ATP synthase gamma subunit
MSVKKVVKVMNFHSLLRVNSARRKVEQAHKYEIELKSVISSIINNRIFIQEKVSLELPKTAKELNIYIGSDFGFCANFNSDVTELLKTDADENDKIIIGKRIKYKAENVIMYMDKEEFPNASSKIFNLVLDGLLNYKYSKINIIYIHYYNMNRQEILKRTILPFNFNDELDDLNVKTNDDFSVEGDIFFIIWNLISIYVSTEIKIAEAWSWASENVKRQMFTNESLKHIDDMEEEKARALRKEKKQKQFEIIVEANNRKIASKRKVN